MSDKNKIHDLLPGHNAIGAEAEKRTKGLQHTPRFDWGSAFYEGACWMLTKAVEVFGSNASIEPLFVPAIDERTPKLVQALAGKPLKDAVGSLLYGYCALLDASERRLPNTVAYFDGQLDVAALLLECDSAATQDRPCKNGGMATPFTTRGHAQADLDLFESSVYTPAIKPRLLPAGDTPHP
jgi:hypothetical protein